MTLSSGQRIFSAWTLVGAATLPIVIAVIAGIPKRVECYDSAPASYHDFAQRSHFVHLAAAALILFVLAYITTWRTERRFIDTWMSAAIILGGVYLLIGAVEIDAFIPLGIVGLLGLIGYGLPLLPFLLIAAVMAGWDEEGPDRALLLIGWLGLLIVLPGTDMFLWIRAAGPLFC